jgi:hypothetical protein
VTIGLGANSVTNDVVIGYNTAVSGGTDGFNVIIGASANTSAQEDVIIGAGAANESSSGGGNVAIGISATIANTIGNSIAIGSGALAGTDYTIVMGTDAGTSGLGSIAIGTYTQYANTICIAASAQIPQPYTDTAPNQLVFGSSNSDAFISNVFIGQGAAPNAAPQSAVTIQLTPASGTDASGSNLIIAPGNGTGAGGSGSIEFQTAPVAASSSTADTLATVGTIDNTGAFTLGASSTTPTHALNTATTAAASGIGTLTNLPTGASGNPTWITIVVNGVTGVIPFWPT